MRTRHASGPGARLWEGFPGRLWKESRALGRAESPETLTRPAVVVFTLTDVAFITVSLKRPPLAMWMLPHRKYAMGDS